MFVLRAGSLPAVTICALAALATVGGCAANSSNYTAQSASTPQRLAQAAVPAEDDGIPAQLPPPSQIRAQPDDPNEPFSKNYGGGNPAALDAQPTARATAAPTPNMPTRKAPIPEDLPPAFRQKLVAALHEDE